jgi:hypothetical protein
LTGREPTGAADARDGGSIAIAPQIIAINAVVAQVRIAANRSMIWFTLNSLRREIQVAATSILARHAKFRKIVNWARRAIASPAAMFRFKTVLQAAEVAVCPG